MKPFTLLLAIVTQIGRKVVQIGMKKMYFYAHTSTLLLKCCEHIFHPLFIVRCLVISQEALYHSSECVPGFLLDICEFWAEFLV